MPLRHASRTNSRSVGFAALCSSAFRGDSRGCDASSSRDALDCMATTKLLTLSYVMWSICAGELDAGGGHEASPGFGQTCGKEQSAGWCTYEQLADHAHTITVTIDA